MKTVVNKVLLVIVVLMTGHILMAQTATLTLEIQGIKKAQGNILIAVTNNDDPHQIVYGKVTVTTTETLIYTLENVPVGKVDVSLFQDLNENHQLDMDGNIPDEPCYRKQKMKIQEGENKLALKLVNVKEWMNR